MNAEFFVGNRQALRARSVGPVVMAGHALVQRKGDQAYAFDQEPNFWYLTGITDPDWWLILTQDESVLVAPDKTQTQLIFDGGLSHEAACKISGCDRTITRKEGAKLLRTLSQTSMTVSSISPTKKLEEALQPNEAIPKLYTRLRRLFPEVIDCRSVLARLRAIKQPEEIAFLNQSIMLTCRAFERVKAITSNASYEYELEAEFDYYFKKSNGRGHAYDPIVAAGKNACTLHYVKNNARLEPSQTIVIDVGARVNGYAADITRTYTIGTPTARQKAVHAAVEKAHFAIIDLIKPGVSLENYQHQSDEIMKDALRSLGLFNKPEDYRQYFPHAISHGLGLDVHESLGGYKEFMPGMVLTVEPGIYIPEEGIGVRIEDDILVTEDGHENLSAALPTGL